MSLTVNGKNYEVPELILKQWNYVIDKGFDWLDNHFGSIEWIDEIDLDRLDLKCGHTCVCGQLFAQEASREGMQGYDWWVQYVMEREPWDEEIAETEIAGSLGFFVPDVDQMESIILDFEQANGGEGIWDSSEEDLVVGDDLVWKLFTRQWCERIQERRG